MWGIVVLMLALGSVSTLAESSSSVMGRLSWCNTMCMCEKESNTTVHCFEEDDLYQLLFSARNVNRLKSRNWDFTSNVYWCNDLCLCHIQSGENFRCTKPEGLTQLILDNIGDTYFLEPERESDIKQETERSVDEEQDPSLEDEARHRRKSDRKKNKKNRKQRKNQKKHKHISEDSLEEPESEPEPQPEPVAEVYPPIISLTPTPPVETLAPTAEHFSYQQEEEDAEVIAASEEPEPLPKQEAVAASPAVTALQPPTRQMMPYSTAESHTPRASARDVEGLSPRVEPVVVEVPKEKKTVASMVSQDLDDLDTTVRNIMNDVMLNQRILLVTVAIAGVAMLGVLILAILGCTNRRHNQAADTAKKRDSTKDGNHSPKINLEEAW